MDAFMKYLEKSVYLELNNYMFRNLSLSIKDDKITNIKHVEDTIRLIMQNMIRDQKTIDLCAIANLLVVAGYEDIFRRGDISTTDIICPTKDCCNVLIYLKDNFVCIDYESVRHRGCFIVGNTKKYTLEEFVDFAKSGELITFDNIDYNKYLVTISGIELENGKISNYRQFLRGEIERRDCLVKSSLNKYTNCHLFDFEIMFSEIHEADNCITLTYHNLYTIRCGKNKKSVCVFSLTRHNSLIYQQPSIEELVKCFPEIIVPTIPIEYTIKSVDRDDE